LPTVCLDSSSSCARGAAHSGTTVSTTTRIAHASNRVNTSRVTPAATGHYRAVAEALDRLANSGGVDHRHQLGQMLGQRTLKYKISLRERS